MDWRARVNDALDCLRGGDVGGAMRWLQQAIEDDDERQVREALPVFPTCPCTVEAVQLGYYGDDDIVPQSVVKPGRQLGDVCGAPVESVEQPAIIRHKVGEMRERREPHAEGLRYRCTEGHWFAIPDATTVVENGRAVVKGTPVPADAPQDITIREEPIIGG